MKTKTLPVSAMPVNFTLAAARKVKSLIEEENDPSLNLRIFIQGGGCSGFEYGIIFDKTVNQEDTIIEQESVKLLIDEASIQFLAGAEVDYQEGVEGERFIIRNPNAKTTCGCGSSFSIE